MFFIVMAHLLRCVRFSIYRDGDKKEQLTFFLSKTSIQTVSELPRNAESHASLSCSTFPLAWSEVLSLGKRQNPPLESLVAFVSIEMGKSLPRHG